ncbi:hypothetical protein MHU86_25514 [Fragilaria crotonensis]|nr:hypothetical protein MHU86_25514 [Fragilaria crotonensis]
MAPAITKVLAEVQRWESVPNRREPFTLEMHAFIANTTDAQKDDCCLMAALADWTLCNLYAGCRGVEWMQTDSSKRDITTYHKNRFGNAYAFTLKDIQCSSTTNKRLSLTEALTYPASVGSIHLRFEEQKNGENGEKKLFVCNVKPKSLLCYAFHAYPSTTRDHNKIRHNNTFKRLQSKRWTPCNITSEAVETCMRDAASKMFNLDPIKNKAELQMWSAHSLRVGACTTLYAMGFHEMEIKHLLRWKSNAFMTYLRNLAVTSRRHNDALADASCIPNFL